MGANSHKYLTPIIKKKSTNEENYVFRLTTKLKILMAKLFIRKYVKK